MKGERSQDIEDKVDFLTSLVQELRLEIGSLRREVLELKLERGTEKAQPKQEKFVDPDDTPIVEGDICEILNSYKGLKGTRFKVTRSENDKIHFRINGYPTWRLRKNVKKISHSRE